VLGLYAANESIGYLQQNSYVHISSEGRDFFSLVTYLPDLSKDGWCWLETNLGRMLGRGFRTRTITPDSADLDDEELGRPDADTCARHPVPTAHQLPRLGRTAASRDASARAVLMERGRRHGRRPPGGAEISSARERDGGCTQNGGVQGIF
jgi:hypothetical protein